ncbi:MAG TPA: hypothetical protein VFD43_01900 [Planctomycetota bacterium]|nr:hypothetical protein [Planctomycetota bacterium]
MAGWPNDNLLALIRRLDRLEIDWVVGGSYASSTFGESRTTQDVDLLIRLRPGQLEGLIEDLRGAYYVPVDSARQAAAARGSFSIIDLGSSPNRKFDLFICAERPLDQEDFQRRRLIRLTSDPDSWGYVSAPEVVILRKLDWYRRGGGVSDQQWRDVLGVLKVQSGRLDLDFIRRMSAALGVSELLDRALVQSGIVAS